MRETISIDDVEVFNEKYSVHIYTDNGELKAIYLDDHNLTYILQEHFRDIIYHAALDKFKIGDHIGCY